MKDGRNAKGENIGEISGEISKMKAMKA